MEKQTAVEWLMEQYNNNPHDCLIKTGLFEKAKAIEKQQMQQPMIRPSDEEITKKSLQYSDWYDKHKPFYNGAKWMLEHIIIINR